MSVNYWDKFLSAVAKFYIFQKIAHWILMSAGPSNTGPLFGLLAAALSFGVMMQGTMYLPDALSALKQLWLTRKKTGSRAVESSVQLP